MRSFLSLFVAGWWFWSGVIVGVVEQRILETQIVVYFLKAGTGGIEGVAFAADHQGARGFYRKRRIFPKTKCLDEQKRLVRARRPVQPMQLPALRISKLPLFPHDQDRRS